VICFLRYARNREDFLLWCCNFTPVTREKYRVGVPRAGEYREIFNSDAAAFGGSNVGNGGRAVAADKPHHHRPASLEITLPPLGVVVFKPRN
jgi:1,4-alpha-glucan branching enzyme